MSVNIFEMDMKGVIIEIHDETSGLLQSLTSNKNIFNFFNFDTSKIVLGTNVLYNIASSRKPQYDFEATNIRIILT